MKQAFNTIAQAVLTRARRQRFKTFGLMAGSAAFCVVLGWSAAVAFERHTQPVPLAATERSETPRLGDRPAPSIEWATPAPRYEEVGGVATRAVEPASTAVPQPIERERTEPREAVAELTGVKFDRMGKVIMVNGRPWTGEVFDYRPMRAVKTVTMKTTAYSPDEKSCGKWADGITASGKSVWMNGGRLVAADRSVPYGTILTIPGYNNGEPVQVWDRGGKIKGNRLDLLYPTHEIALQWGVQDLPVVFWEYVQAD